MHIKFVNEHGQLLTIIPFNFKNEDDTVDIFYHVLDTLHAARAIDDSQLREYVAELIESMSVYTGKNYYHIPTWFCNEYNIWQGDFEFNE